MAVQQKRPSAGEDGDGQQDDVVLGIDLSYGPENRRKHWRAGIKIHTDLYCQHYKEDITHNDLNCPNYQPVRPIVVKTYAHKFNGYKERKEFSVSCSNCQHSINKGLRFKKI